MVARTSLPGCSVPISVQEIVERLAEAGHESYLVGGCVRDLLGGREAQDFDLASSAAPEAVLELFPHAVPIGTRHGTVMIPTPQGPVDVTRYRAGSRIEDDLAHRDFAVNAMGYDPRREELLDPFSGREDLARARLRAVRSAKDRFAEDPLRALRAARLAAALSLEVDPDVEAAMLGAREALRAVATERIRAELSALLLAPGAAEGLGLLRRTGIEDELAPGAATDAAAVVGAVPADLALRLAAWLRGAAAASIVRRRRFPKRVSARALKLLSLHPIEGVSNAAREASVRRLIKRAGEENLEALFALREAELSVGSAAREPEAEGARARLGSLREAVERMQRAGQLALRRFDLAIDGRDVMKRLHCEPGPVVGRALSYLTERVVEDPTCNTPEKLRALLTSWAARQGADASPARR